MSYVKSLAYLWTLSPCQFSLNPTVLLQGAGVSLRPLRETNQKDFLTTKKDKEHPEKKNMLGIRVPLSDYQESVCPNSRTCWLDDFCVDLSLRIVGGSYVKIPRHRTVAFLAVFQPQLNSSLSQPPIVSVNSFHDYFADFLLVIGLSLITKMGWRRQID